MHVKFTNHKLGAHVKLSPPPPLTPSNAPDTRGILPRLPKRDIPLEISGPKTVVALLLLLPQLLPLIL